MHDFNGPAYMPARDRMRLTAQMERIFSIMKDGEWRSLDQIRAQTGDPQASISAQLRHLRKERFGAHRLDRRYDGNGLYSYRLIINAERKL